ncbi:MAG: tRNA (5-methylaminomethyl-2-thiouridine)(34)-methyltransferase MnmD [Paracoccaceae bacterium]
MQDQQAKLEWRDGLVPVSTRFDDPYYSLENGLAETRHVFLDGNDLPARFVDGFHVGELGFGTGLNFLAVVMAWIASGTPGTLRFTSFEAYPIHPDDMEQALAPFTELGGLRDQLVAFWRDHRSGSFLDNVWLDVIGGDARQALPTSDMMVDAWFLDGFSPAKNPELWEDDLMHNIGAHTKAGGTFATYTAAGFVRRALDEAGFDVRRIPGFGRKRHMSVGQKR